MLLAAIVLWQLNLHISFAGTSTIKQRTNVGRTIAPTHEAPRAPMVTASIASHVIGDFSGRTLEPTLFSRHDKMNDLFYNNHDPNHSDNSDEEPGSRNEGSGKSSRRESLINRLPLGDLTKIVEFDQLESGAEEPELVVNNHQSTPETNPPPVNSNSRHYNSYHLNSNALFSSNNHGHNSQYYGKYSPNIFANNYNLNYIHSLLTSKPSGSMSLQSMQSLLNSNPNGLALNSFGTAHSASNVGNYVSSTPGYQTTSTTSIRGQQVQHHPPSDHSRGPQNSTPSLAADHSSSTHCGRQQVAAREPRIVGGNNTYEGEFPWAVSIQRHGNHHCGGVIVGHQWILTAAHCVRSQLVGNLVVRTGGHTLTRSVNSISGHLEKDYLVEQIIMHDDFSRFDNISSMHMKSSASTNNADIALLKLKQEIRWNEHAWPVCFPDREAGNFSGHDAVVVGWGKLNEKSEEFSNELQKVKLTIIDNKVCQNWFRQAGREMPIDDRIICAGFKNGGKDACHGDSGGPLLSRLNGQYVVVGVVSTGIGCARPLLPGLYSRVSSYIGWIEKYIANQ